MFRPCRSFCSNRNDCLRKRNAETISNTTDTRYTNIRNDLISLSAGIGIAVTPFFGMGIFTGTTIGDVVVGCMLILGGIVGVIEGICTYIGNKEAFRQAMEKWWMVWWMVLVLLIIIIPSFFVGLMVFYGAIIGAIAIAWTIIVFFRADAKRQDGVGTGTSWETMTAKQRSGTIGGILIPIGIILCLIGWNLSSHNRGLLIDYDLAVRHSDSANWSLNRPGGSVSEASRAAREAGKAHRDLLTSSHSEGLMFLLFASGGLRSIMLNQSYSVMSFSLSNTDFSLALLVGRSHSA